MARFEERYFGTIAAGSTTGGADVLGAAGLAGREVSENERGIIERLRREPLGMALYRLFAGDKHAAVKVIEILAKRAVGKAYRIHQQGRGPELDQIAGKIIAEQVLEWYRDPICKPCGGHGFERIAGTPTLSSEACMHCKASGRVPFDRQFSLHRLELAQWLASELERDLQRASALAMQMLAPKLDLRGEPLVLEVRTMAEMVAAAERGPE